MKITTDLRLFGLPVVFDTELSRKVIDLVNSKGHRIRITLDDPAPRETTGEREP